jgi:hypothetical protein
LLRFGSGRATRRWLLALFGGALVLAVVGLAAGFFVVHDTPRGLVNTVPVPRWARPFTQIDGVNYRIHVGLATLFEDVGAPPSATAAEWFKGAYHARTPGQIAHTANGLVAVQQRSSSAQLEAALCPALRTASADGNVGRIARQAEALRLAGISCAPKPLDPEPTPVGR